MIESSLTDFLDFYGEEDIYMTEHSCRTTLLSCDSRFHHYISLYNSERFEPIIIIIINLTCIALFLKNSIALNSRKDKSKM